MAIYRSRFHVSKTKIEGNNWRWSTKLQSKNSIFLSVSVIELQRKKVASNLVKLINIFPPVRSLCSTSSFLFLTVHLISLHSESPPVTVFCFCFRILLWEINYIWSISVVDSFPSSLFTWFWFLLFSSSVFNNFSPLCEYKVEYFGFQAKQKWIMNFCF